MNIYEDEQYIQDFAKHTFGGKSSKLSQMLITENSLASELQELYGDEEMP